MAERLRPRDLAFLVDESATAPRHNATVEIFDPEDSGFDYDRLVALISDRISFVPRYRQRIQQVPGPGRQPGLGRRRRLRHRLPRTPLRAASSRARPTSSASSSPGSCPARSTAAARSGRSTSSRGSPTAGWRCSTRPTRPSSTASTPSTSARCSSTATTTPRCRSRTGRRLARPPAALVGRPARLGAEGHRDRAAARSSTPLRGTLDARPPQRRPRGRARSPASPTR